MSKLKRYLHRHAKRILIVFGLVILLLGIIFVVIEKDLFVPKATPTEEEALPPVSITEDYPAEAKAAMTDFQLFLEKQKTAEEITQRRERLLSLTITKEYQHVHLSLVMIADALLAGEEGQAAEREHALEMINQVLQEHPEYKL